MTYEDERAAFLDTAYLAACAVNGQIPDAERVSRMDLTALYKTAERHLLTGITAMALESAGVKDEAFTQAKGKAVRKAVVFDAERAAVLEKLEEAGIWHMPLKGSVLKDLYPAIGMRQMSDNDILFDAARTEDVRAIMEGLGFDISGYGKGVHDSYVKPPVCCFEMHRALFGASSDDRLRKYFVDVKSRLLQDENSSFGFHFSDEDFYIYMIAHEYKHYSGSGTGLRSLLDTYVYLSKKDETMERPYISRELEKLGIADFEARNRTFALHLFGSEALTEADEEMLGEMLSSGAYGTITNRVKKRLAKNKGKPFGKARYVLARLFMSRKEAEDSFPVFSKHPILMPVLPIYRILRGLTVRRRVLRAELKALVKSRSDRE